MVTMLPGGGVTRVGDTKREIRRPVGDGGGVRRLCSVCARDGWRPMNLGDRSPSADDCSDATNCATTES